MVARALTAFALLALVGCASRGGPERPELATQDPLCGAPRRALVAELDSSSALLRTATDALAEGLAELGFEVLSPRRASPGRRPNAVNDWIFTPEISQGGDGRLKVNVELYSRVNQRRVWAIADALADLRIENERAAVVDGIEAALRLFEQDLLACRAAR